MSASELIPIGGALVAIIGAAAAFWSNRKKPVLDAVSAEQISVQVKKDNNSLNLARDRRVLDLERWADAMRPAMRSRDDRLDVLSRLIAEDHVALGRPVPELPPLPPWPEFPEPRPLPA
jgi:hypothetical protein